jgi:penicillin amidase
MRRFLKRLLLILLALVLVLAAFALLRVRRAWPQTKGEIAVAGLSAPVRVTRDAWGVPQIYAANEHDLFFAQGYVHAQDRFWQMEYNRHVSGGRLSEMFGKPTLATDRLLRTLGIRRNAERDWTLLEPGTRAILEAYAQGVNAYLESHRGALPVELSILGVEPAPWTPVDSLAWVEMVGFSLGQNQGVELKRAAIGAKLGADAVRQLLPPAGDDAVIVSPGEGSYGSAPESPGGPLLSWLLGPPAFARGSNSWVVHGSRTATGRPMLANDTHLGLNMPSEWYENGLHAGGFDVVGFSFAGVPTVLIGHNARIAWGITSMNGDAEDLYVETLDPGRKQYRAGDGWHPLTVLREPIRLKNGKSIDSEVVLTRHGPLVNEVMDLKDSPPLALRWTAADGSRTLDALVHLNQARDWGSFRQALSLWGAPALNLTYADVDGHIGYQGTGRLPLRAPGHDGTAPVPGSDDRFEWRGAIPFDAMPKLFDPPSGYIVTANNKVVGDDYPYLIARDYADPYRAQRIAQRLAAAPKVTVDEMRSIQSDVRSIPGEELRPYLLAVQPSGDLQKKALEQVRSWDLQFRTDSAGATIYYAWYAHLLPDIVEDELGEELTRTSKGMIYNQTPMYVRMMRDPRNRWFDDRRTAQVETRDDIVRRAFGEAVAWLSQRLGDDPSKWQWGKVHRSVFAHQPFGNVPPLARLFNGPSLPVPGETFTVSAGVPSPARPYQVPFGSSQRLIVDLSDLGRSLAINSTGQCAQLFHRHRSDQTPLWARNEYRPMLFSPQAVNAGAEETLTLKPGSR